MFFDLSAAATIPVEPSCLKQFDIFDPGHAVSNPYALVPLYGSPSTFVVNFYTTASGNVRVDSGNLPLFNNILMYLVTSSPVVNRPEWPATPPYL
jgi:hypothetical protein